MQLLRVPKVLVRYLYHAVENHASENMCLVTRRVMVHAS